MQDAAQRGQPVVGEHLPGLSINALKERAAAASAELYNRGIYWDARAIDPILPFDVLPCGAPNRVIRAIEVRSRVREGFRMPARRGFV